MISLIKLIGRLSQIFIKLNTIDSRWKYLSYLLISSVLHIDLTVNKCEIYFQFNKVEYMVNNGLIYSFHNEPIHKCLGYNLQYSVSKPVVLSIKRNYKYVKIPTIDLIYGDIFKYNPNYNSTVEILDFSFIVNNITQINSLFDKIILQLKKITPFFRSLKELYIELVLKSHIDFNFKDDGFYLELLLKLTEGMRNNNVLINLKITMLRTYLIKAKFSFKKNDSPVRLESRNEFYTPIYYETNLRRYSQYYSLLYVKHSRLMMGKIKKYICLIICKFLGKKVLKNKNKSFFPFFLKKKFLEE
jgi:hypothetical protein